MLPSRADDGLRRHRTVFYTVSCYGFAVSAVVRVQVETGRCNLAAIVIRYDHHHHLFLRAKSRAYDAAHANVRMGVCACVRARTIPTHALIPFTFIF